MHTCTYTYVCMYVCMYVTYIAAYDKEAGGGDESRILKIARCMTRSGGGMQVVCVNFVKTPYLYHCL
jgi:hypothetical protein